MTEDASLDFQGTVSALQAILGRQVQVTIGNLFDVADRAVVAIFTGRLTRAERPIDPQLELTAATEEERVYTFFVGLDHPFNSASFVLDERALDGALHLSSLSNERLDQEIRMRLNGTDVAVTVPSAAYLRELGVEE